MTPLHLRRRIRSALTILRGVSPDEAAEARAVFNTMYDDCDDESIADLMRIVTDELRFQRERVDHYKGEADKAEQERDKLRTELADVDEALYAALDIRPDSLQAATMYAPGGVRRLAAERDEAVAMISTLRAQNQGYAAELAEVDQILGRALGYPTMGPEVGGDHTTVCTREHTPASLAIAAAAAIAERDALRPPPKRKRTKEERAKVTAAYLAEVWAHEEAGIGWAIRRELALMGPSTSRDIATRMWARISVTPDESEIRNDMRWVQDFARAGYLTVAKGPGGVRVYSLKEGA